MPEAARKIKTEKITMVVGCTKPNHCIDTKKMPSSGSLYVEAPRHGQIERIVEDELNKEMRSSVLESFEMTQLMPEGLQYVADSAQPPPVIEDIEGQTQLRWSWEGDGVTGPHTVTYQVEPLTEGVWELGGELEFVDAGDLGRTLPMPAQSITVAGLCEPQVTPPTPTPTDEPVPPTDTPLPEPPTATPVPPTPEPGPIFLPVTLNERCLPDERLGDIVLVIDMSSSMSRQAEDGVQKKQAVIEAVQTFVERLDLTPNDRGQHDQVSIVGFNSSAWIQQSLTHDRAAVMAALTALDQRMDSGTRLDLAFEVGASALPEADRKPGNTPVMILLTDGLPSQVPPHPDTGRVEDTVDAAAQAVKDQGITVYAIGFGRTDDAADPADRVDPDMLRQCASDPDKAFIAPGADRLREIYSEIANVFTCPTGRHDWSLPWP